MIDDAEVSDFSKRACRQQLQARRAEWNERSIESPWKGWKAQDACSRHPFHQNEARHQCYTNSRYQKLVSSRSLSYAGFKHLSPASETKISLQSCLHQIISASLTTAITYVYPSIHLSPHVSLPSNKETEYKSIRRQRSTWFPRTRNTSRIVRCFEWNWVLARH